MPVPHIQLIQFRLGEPEFVGYFPMRRDITVLPADKPRGKWPPVLYINKSSKKGLIKVKVLIL